MSNYNNNFPRTPGADSPIRFNKRPRYAANDNGGKNSPRFKYQKQCSYKYSTNRSCASDNFQHNQYEKSPNRFFYSNSPKRTNYSQQQSNKQSSYPHTTIPSSPATFTSSTQNINSSSQPDRLQSKTASATVTAENNQLQPIFTPNIVENNNYYGFPFNFYPPTYSADLPPAASSSSFGAVDGMSQYLWQTITSTPPPKLPQQQPPLPLQQPPALPPLPSVEGPSLPPPPPIPSSIFESVSSPAECLDQSKSNQNSGAKTIVKMKAKRKAMSARYKLSKTWCEKDALLALKAEEENAKKSKKNFILIVRFPDPEISREIVKSYSPDIESVHFQLNFAPRYCLIHLKPGTDVEKTIDHLSKIQFGTGYLSVEIKQVPLKAHSTKLSEIDPLTLYVGNLPTTIVCKTLKDHFPGAARIDIGFAQRMKYTRYAFIRYQNVHLAIEAYKRMLDVEIGGRSLTIRFKRLITASEGNKDADAEHNDDLHDDLISQAVVDEPENTVNDLAQADGDDAGSIDSSDVNDNANTNIAGEFPQQVGISVEDNITETNECTASPLSTNIGDKTISQKESTTLLLNIKPDPDDDPNDVVARNNMFENRYANSDSTIKQERANLALYEEFFERPQTRDDVCEKSNRSNSNSLASNTDDTDTISQVSSNSLREFLQTCPPPQRQTNSNVKDGDPQMKINKLTIKREPSEDDHIANKENSILSSNDSAGTVCVKQEAEEGIEHLNTSAESIGSINSRTVPISRKRAANANNSEDSHNNTTSNDDIVPSTALFFTSDYHNKWTNSRKNCDNEDFYDEFYETRVSSQTSTSQARFKTEPLEMSIGKGTNERSKNAQPVKSQNCSSSITNNNNCLGKPNRFPSKMVDDDDDLVPAQNLLGSYRPNRNVVKHETEYDDMFSIPFSKSRESNTASNEGLPTKSRTQITECTNIIDVTKSHATESNDEDVIVVSANIPPAPKEKKSDNSANNNNLVIPRITDLVSFNYKPVSVSIPNREVSTFLTRDNLNELYDQLDADSDSDL